VNIIDQEKKQILDAANNNPFAKLLDIKITELERGSAAIEIVVSPTHLNPQGTLHGGVLSAMADIAMGAAVRTLGKVGVTVNLNCNFLAPGHLGDKIVARGKVIHQGNTIMATECTVTRDEDVLVKTTGVWFVVK